MIADVQHVFGIAKGIRINVESSDYNHCVLWDLYGRCVFSQNEDQQCSF